MEMNDDMKFAIKTEKAYQEIKKGKCKIVTRSGTENCQKRPTLPLGATQLGPASEQLSGVVLTSSEVEKPGSLIWAICESKCVIWRSRVC